MTRCRWAMGGIGTRTPLAICHTTYTCVLSVLVCVVPRSIASNPDTQVMARD
jgi:hypothetical protein